MQLPDTSSIEFWHREWPVIKAAPFSFIISLILATIVVWFVVWLIHRERLNNNQHTIEHRGREIERLEKLVKEAERKSDTGSTSRKYAEDKSDPFVNPQWQMVEGKTFTNETIELDGKLFYQCEFINARFVYRGTAPCDMRKCAVTGSVVLETENGAIRCYTHLERIIEAMGKVVHVSVDKDGKSKPIVPNVTEIKPPSLADQTFALCRELKTFLREIGPRPEIKEQGASAVANLMKSSEYRDWKNKFEGGYRQRFAMRLLEIRNELQVNGQQDNEVDHFVLGEFIADPRTLKAVLEDLIVMAAKLDT
jgi:hypothetical protein